MSIDFDMDEDMALSPLALPLFYASLCLSLMHYLAVSNRNINH